MSSRTRPKPPKKARSQLRESTIAQLRRKFRIRSLDELKREAIKRASKVTGSNDLLAAKLLGIHKETFYKWQIKFKMRPPRTRHHRFGSLQRLRVVPELRQQAGIKTLRELRQGEITRVLQLTNGNPQLTAKLLAIGKNIVYRHVHSQTR